MSGWGYYAIYDAVRSNKQAEAVFFSEHRRLVIMPYEDSGEDEAIIIDIPYAGMYEVDPATTAEAIGKLLKDRFKTEYVTFHPFQKGEWV